jgi:hypothetical protein
MKLLLHLGFSKTGTTSLQVALDQSRDALMAAGVLYPKADIPPAHHVLAAVMFDQGRAPRHVYDWHDGPDGARAHGLTLLANLAEQIARTKPDLVILSSEALTNEKVTRQDFERLFALLRPLATEIEPVFYVREPASDYLSLMQERGKLSRRPMAPCIRPVRRILEDLATVAGRAPTVLPFERAQLAGGDIVSDFARRFLDGRIEPSALPRKSDNVSFSGEALAIAMELRGILSREEDGVRDDFAARFLPLLRKADQQGYRPIALKPDVAQAIRRAASDFIWLRDQYGIVFDALDYGSIDGTPIPAHWADVGLDGLIEIEENRHLALSEAVLASVLG